MAIQTRTALAAAIPPATLKAAGAGYDPKRGPVDFDWLLDVFHTFLAELDYLARTRVMADSVTALVTTEGTETAADNLALYDIDLSTGDVMVGGIVGNIAAEDNHVVVGAGASQSCKLDGAAPLALTAAGKSYISTMVIVLIAGVPTWHMIFGAEAADGAEVAPTDAQIEAALVADGVADMLTDRWLRVAEITWKRVTGTPDTLTTVHSAPTTAAVRAYRATGHITGIGA